MQTEKERIELLDTICPLCFEEEENRDHLFEVQIHATNLVQLQIGYPCPCTLIAEGKDFGWLSKKDHLASQYFGMALENLASRNQMVFQNKHFDPIQIANAAADFTVEFNDANMTVVTSATVTQPVEACALHHLVF